MNNKLLIILITLSISPLIKPCKQVINLMDLAATTQQKPISTEQVIYWLNKIKICCANSKYKCPLVHEIEVALAQNRPISKMDVLEWRNKLIEQTKHLNLSCKICSCNNCRKIPNTSISETLGNAGAVARETINTVGALAKDTACVIHAVGTIINSFNHKD